ncbi:ABC transporter substrate-binding protein [Kitasatospora sp. NPDC059571]|uniref:ABC transporter substrate-binding protein n=1 Tax=Kitasatospora sp. NPDC059571 TaxID=3346871 RepID=UPI0036BBD2E7
MALDSAPLSSDRHWPADYDARLVGESLIRTLVPAASDPGQVGIPTGGSATAVERLNRDGCWRVRLDESLHWSDGTGLSAADVLRSASRIAEHPRSTAFRLLFGGADRDFPVQAVDDATLEFTFARPLSFARELLTLPQLAPVHSAGGQIGAPSLGDYELAAMTENIIRVTRHAYAQEPSGRNPESLEFRVHPQLADAMGAFSRGLVDISPTTSFGRAELAAFGSHKNLLSRNISIFGSLEFGAEAPGLASRPDLRHALGAALDRRRLVESCPGLVSEFWEQTGPWKRPAEVVSPGAPVVPSGAQVDGIRAALGRELEIPYADFSPNGAIVSEVCRQLADLFGITAAPRPVSYRTYVRTVLSQRHSLLYTLTTADFPHPAALLLPWRSDSPHARRSGFADSALDGAIDEASAAIDRADELWRLADLRWLTLMPRVPLVQVRAHCVHSDRVSDVRLSAGGLIDFGRLALSPHSPPAAPHGNEAVAP